MEGSCAGAKRGPAVDVGWVVYAVCCGLLRGPAAARPCGSATAGRERGESMERRWRARAAWRFLRGRWMRGGVHVPSIGASGYNMRSRVMIEILKHSKI